METHVCLALASRLGTNDNSDGLPGGLALRTCNSTTDFKGVVITQMVPWRHLFLLRCANAWL